MSHSQIGPHERQNWPIMSPSALSFLQKSLLYAARSKTLTFLRLDCHDSVFNQANINSPVYLRVKIIYLQEKSQKHLNKIIFCGIRKALSVWDFQK